MANGNVEDSPEPASQLENINSDLRRLKSDAISPFSASDAIFDIILTASAGYCPTDVSPESITASVPSRMALATSDASALVGLGLLIMDSSIWVAVMTTFPFLFALLI